MLTTSYPKKSKAAPDPNKSKIMSDFQNSVLNYYKHLMNREYVEGVLTSAPMEEIYQQLADMLLSGERENIFEACLFVQDVRLTIKGEVAEKFSDAVYDSPIINAFEHLTLNSPSHWVRRRVIYALGKIGATRSLPVLIDTFYKFWETDPLLLPSLMGEIRWLRSDSSPILAMDAAHNWSYLTRWTAIDDIRRFCDEPDSPEKICLDRLADDEMEVIRQEARYWIEEQRIHREVYTLPKKERKAFWKSLAKFEPRLSFDTATTRFHLYLSQQNSPEDYHVMELAKFVDGLLSD